MLQDFVEARAFHAFPGPSLTVIFSPESRGIETIVETTNEDPPSGVARHHRRYSGGETGYPKAERLRGSDA